jgi:hypothetical protein
MVGAICRGQHDKVGGIHGQTTPKTTGPNFITWGNPGEFLQVNMWGQIRVVNCLNCQQIDKPDYIEIIIP